MDDVARDIEKRGLTAEREIRVNTPNGERGTRYIDIAGRDPRTGDLVETHQIGRANRDGSPVARERRAMNDIEEATGVRPSFRQYND